MISQADLIMVALAFLIGYIDDVTGPQAHHYESQIVVVYKKYQCPTYCAVDHHHFVYFSSDSNGMIIDEERLGPKYKPPKKDKQRTLQ